MIELYFLIGVIITIFLFINAEVERGYFTEELGFTSFYELITNFVVISAFLIIWVFWPFFIVLTIYQSTK